MSKITIPLSTITDHRFRAAMTALTAQPLSMPASFRLAQCQKEFETHQSAFDEARNKRILELGEKQEGGNYRITDPEKFKTYAEEMTALVNGQEITLPISKKIDVGGITLAPMHTLMLLDLIQEPPEETE